MLKRFILTCDYCSEQFEPESEEDLESRMEEAFGNGWFEIRSWFGEKYYCSIDCLSNIFNLN